MDFTVLFVTSAVTGSIILLKKKCLEWTGCTINQIKNADKNTNTKWFWNVCIQATSPFLWRHKFEITLKKVSSSGINKYNTHDKHGH
jgi:hypothetical protein